MGYQTVAADRKSDLLKYSKKIKMRYFLEYLYFQMVISWNKIISIL